MEQFIEKLKDIEKTYQELEQKLADPAVLSSPANFKRLAKAAHQLRRTVDPYHAWQEAQSHLEGAQEVFRTESDKDIREMAEQEIADLKNRDQELSNEIGR